jgi:hypothetical protein
MKNIILAVYTILILLLLGNLHGQQVQWVQTQGPAFTSGWPHLVSLNQKLFASSSNAGISMSSDGGDSWHARNNGLGNLQIRSLHVAGNNLYAGTGGSNFEAGVFRSSDEGLNWIDISPPIQMQGVYVTSITSGNYYVYCAVNHMVFRAPYPVLNTLDWEDITPQNISITQILSLEVAFDSLFMGTRGDGIYMTAQSNILWEPMFSGIIYGSDWIQDITLHNNILYACNNFNSPYLYYSTTQGQSWQPVWSLSYSAFNVFGVGNDIYCGMTGGVSRSTDNGYTWQLFNQGGIEINNSVIQGFAVANQTVFAATSNTGVWRLDRLPDIEAGSNGPVCAGSDLLLTASMPGATQYQWVGPFGFTSNLQNPILSNSNVNHNGIFTVTASTQQGIYSTTVPVNIQVPHQNFSLYTNAPVCSGNNLILNVSFAFGYSFHWDGPNGFSSNQDYVQIPNATSDASGMYSVTLTGTVCGSEMLTLNAQVLDSIGIAPAFTACAGSDLNLFAMAPSNGQYAWTGPGGYQSFSPSPIIPNIQPQQAGIYSVTIQSDCGSGLFTTAVTVNSPPPSGLQQTAYFTCAGNDIAIQANAQSGVSYLWTGPDGYSVPRPLLLRQNSNTGMAGTYTLQMTVPGCSPVSQFVQVHVNTPVVLQPISNSPVCIGGILQLSTPNHPNTQYTWATPQGVLSSGNTLNIQPAQLHHSGTYTLKAQTTGCPESIVQLSATVAAPVSQVQIQRTSEYQCVGSPLTLQATHHPNASYTWTGPNGLSQSGLQSSLTIPNTTAVNNGVYQVQVVVPGCQSANASLHITLSNMASVTATSNAPVCEGRFLILQGAVSQGSSAVWVGPNGTIPGSGSNRVIPQAQPGMTGTYYLLGIVPGCPMAIDSVQVVVGGKLSPLQISTNSPACLGETLLLNGPHIANAHMQWTGPLGFQHTGSSAQISPITMQHAGFYVYTVNSPGCGSTSRTTLVQIINTNTINATVTPTTACINGIAHFQSQVPPGTLVSWQGPDGFYSNMPQTIRIKLKPMHAGVYTMTAQIAGCTPIIRNVTLNIVPCREGESETEDDHTQITNAPAVKIAPNPVHESLKIQSPTYPIHQIQMFDLQAKSILNIENLTHYEYHLNLLHAMPPGTYLLHVTTSETTEVQKIVVY